ERPEINSQQRAHPIEVQRYVSSLDRPRFEIASLARRSTVCDLSDQRRRALPCLAPPSPVCDLSDQPRRALQSDHLPAAIHAPLKAVTRFAAQTQPPRGFGI